MELDVAPDGGGASCLNCGEQLEKRFCGACGQQALEGRLTFRGLAAIVGERFFERSLWAAVRAVVAFSLADLVLGFGMFAALLVYVQRFA